MSKGKRRERQAAQLYEDAGFDVEKPIGTKYDQNTDYWNLFDIMATDGDELIFTQVKSNRASGIEAWHTDAAATVPLWCTLHFLVFHDREGWRLANVKRAPFGGPVDYEWVVDERQMAEIAPHGHTERNIGDGVREWLG